MNTLYKIYQIFVLLPLLVIDTIIIGVLIMTISPLGDEKWRAKTSGLFDKWWGWVLVRGSLLSVKVEGREKMDPKQSYIIVANHQSCYDIFVMFGFIGRTIRFMMKASLRNIFVLGRAAYVGGHIFVDTSRNSKVQATYQKAIRNITDGVSLVVYPEGHRSLDGKLGPFKRGAFAIADELQLPVVPVTIKGTFEVMPKQRDFKFVHWHPITMIVHDPIYPNGQGAENISYLMTESRKAIESAM